MEGAAMQLATLVKEEPLEVFSDACDSGLGLDAWYHLNPDMDENEMDLKIVKTEETSSQREEGVVHLKQSSSPLGQRKLIGSEKKNELTCQKCVQISKAYANLYKNEKMPPTPLRHFIFPSIIIECPDCMLPVSGPSRSSFLKLLRHVSRKHEASFDLLFADIVDRYATFVEYMQNKIVSKTRRLYMKKLRRLEHRKN